VAESVEHCPDPSYGVEESESVGVPLKVFVTGATGYIGRQLVSRFLSSASVEEVICLVRDPLRARLLSTHSRLRIIEGDLLDPSSYSAELSGTDAVVHLAAVTGIAAPQEFWKVNLDGTRHLLEASSSAGVGHFLFVSSIAARYPDQWHYPYAQSKAAAERLVLESPLHSTIVRPTIVTGPEAPVARGLSKLRRGRLLFLFGTGEVKVQPIAASDLVDRLCRITIRPPAADVIELGGGDVLSLKTFLGMLTARDAHKSLPVRLPVGLTRWVLAAVESLAWRWLPLTAGQLALFTNDSTAAPADFESAGTLMPLEDLVAECRT
jgi:nucleoside-diphosphate-sugar epimerase